MKNKSNKAKLATSVALVSLLAFGTVGSVSASATDAKVMWGKTELKAGQLGKVVISADTPLLKKLPNGEYETVRILKKGEEYRVYTYNNKDDGFYGVGGGLHIGAKASGVKYNTPSKAKLAALKATLPPVKEQPVTTPVAPPVVETPVVIPPVVETPVVIPPMEDNYERPPVYVPPVVTVDLEKIAWVQGIINSIPAGYTFIEALDLQIHVNGAITTLTEEEKKQVNFAKFHELSEFISGGGNIPPVEEPPVVEVPVETPEVVEPPVVETPVETPVEETPEDVEPPSEEAPVVE